MPPEKKYKKPELAKLFREANAQWVHLDDEQVLKRAFALWPGEQAKLEPEAPPPPAAPVPASMKDLAERALAIQGKGLNEAGDAAQKAGPLITGGLAEAARKVRPAAAAAINTVGRQVKAAVAIPPYAGAGVAKGMTLGYVDPTKALDISGLEVPELIKKRAEVAGEFLGAVAPISKISQGVGMGLKAAGIAAKARPALTGLAQAAATGLTYGGVRKPAEGESRGQNALNDAATFMALTGTGMAFDKVLGELIANYSRAGAYEAARQQIVDVFVKKGASPAKAAEMAEAGLQAAIKRANLKPGEQIPAKDWRAVRETVAKGGQVNIGPEAPKPPAEVTPNVPEVKAPPAPVEPVKPNISELEQKVQNLKVIRNTNPGDERVAKALEKAEEKLKQLSPKPSVPPVPAPVLKPEEMSTEDLEKHIDKRYEEKAPQAELDKLEKIYAGRISEEDLKLTEEDINQSEATNGADLEHQLIRNYANYIKPAAERTGMMEDADIIGNMRAAVETFTGKPPESDVAVLAAAKDAYENAVELKKRYMLGLEKQRPSDILTKAEKLKAKRAKITGEPEIIPPATEKAAAVKLTEAQIKSSVLDFYRPYVTRGETISQLKAGQMGMASGPISIMTGGRAGGKKYSTDHVVVELADGRTFIYKLKDVHSQILKEKTPAAKKDLKAIKEEAKKLKEEVQAAQKEHTKLVKTAKAVPPPPTTKAQAAPEPVAAPGPAESFQPVKVTQALPAIKQLIGGRYTTIPILKRFIVEKGNLTATDLEGALVIKTDLPDGVYQLIGNKPEPAKEKRADYPVIPKPEGKIKGMVGRDELINGLVEVSKASSVEDDRHFLNGVLLYSEKGQAKLVATDGRRLAVKPIAVKGLPDGQWIIPNNRAQIKALSALDSPTFNIQIGTNQISFSAANGYYVSRLIEGNFPSYMTIVIQGADRADTNIIMDRSALEEALKILRPYMPKKDPVIKFHRAGDGYDISAYNKETDITKTAHVPATIKPAKFHASNIKKYSVVMPLRIEDGPKGKPFQIAVNANFISDAISITTGDKIYIAGQVPKTGHVATAIFVTGQDLAVKSLGDIKAAAKGLRGEPPAAAKGAGLASGEAPRLDRELADVQPATSDKEFKLWRATEEIINKYANRWGEGGYIPRGAAGVFYDDTKNIYLQSANNVYVAVHEVLHYIDDKFDWYKRILKIKGLAKNGNPIYDPATKEIRKLLTEFYVKFYPKANPSAPLALRAKEGMATLIMKAVESPELFKDEKWARLYALVFTPGSPYHLAEFNELLADGRRLMGVYKALDPDAKMSARVADIARPKQIQEFFTPLDKVNEVLFDQLHKLDVIAERTGVEFSDLDPYIAAQAYRYWGSLAENNINGEGKGTWIISGGNMVKVLEQNYKDLMMLLGDGGTIKRFNNFLLARDTVGGYNKLEKTAARIKYLTGGEYDIEHPDAEALKAWADTQRQGMMPSEFRELLEEVTAAIKSYLRDKETLRRNNISRELAEAVYQPGLQDEKFKQAVKLYDEFNGVNLRMLLEMGRISGKRYAEMAKDPTYASFKRDIFSMVTGEGYPKQFRQTGTMPSVSSLKARKGSELPFVGPLYAQALDHAEILRKALRQNTVNTLYQLVAKQPEFLGGLFQRVPLKTYVDEDGAIQYPQLQDPDILMAWFNGVPAPLHMLDRDFHKILNSALMTPGNIDTFSKVIMWFSRQFTKGTTAAYLPFLISNIPIDQFSALAQNRTNYKPFIDQVKTLWELANNDNSPAGQYLREYLTLGADRQTLARFMNDDIPPDEMYRKIVGETTRLEKALELVNKAGDIITAPSMASELFTRAQEYINARMHGKSSIAAAEMAGQVTAPFHHIGTWGGAAGQTAIKSIAFANPAFQVLHQQGRAYKDKETQKHALIWTAALTVALVSSEIGMWYYASEAQKKNYKNMQQGEKENFLWIPDPSARGRETGRILKMKIPANYGIMGNLINLVIEDTWKKAKHAPSDYLQTATAMLPEQINLTDPTRMFFSWLPQLIRPAIEVAFKQKTFPKVLPMTSAAAAGLPRAEQVTDQTGWAARALARTKLAAALNLSPIQIDHLIEGYMGRAVRLVSGRMTASNPIYNDMYINSGRGLETFYKIRDEVNGLKNKQRKLAEEGTGEMSEKEMNLLYLSPEIMSVSVMMGRYSRLGKNKQMSASEEREYWALRDEILNQVDSLWAEYDKVAAAPPAK